MEKTRSILETVGNATYVGIHYIIFYGRKYPLIPAAYLLLFIWFFFLRKPALPPAPVSSTPGGSYAPGGSYYFPGLNSPQSQRQPTPAPAAPVIQTAQVSAFQSGDRIILRWNRPVEGHQIYLDDNKINVSCQPKECQIKIGNQPNLIYTKWNESGQSFEKSFSF